MKCVECNKSLTPDEIGYGHDCEAYYEQGWYDDVLKSFFNEHVKIIPIGFEEK
jgi:hypothetical protein